MCEICDRSDDAGDPLWADWTDDDRELATARGWGIFGGYRSDEAEAALVDGLTPSYGHRPFELQALDEAKDLDDEGAWIDAASGVTHGDRVSRRAFEFLQKYSPREYAAIVQLTGVSLDADDNQPI